jgi:hypothetical protein
VKCGEPLVLTLAMDPFLFLRKCACPRMAANGLGIILFSYADWLHAKGHSRNTIHLYTQAVEHFGFWRAKRHPGSQNVQPSEVAEFLHSHLSRCDCPAPAATSGCRNTSSPQSSEDEGPIGVLVADFDQHLAKVCGLSPATRFYRRRYALKSLGRARCRFRVPEWRSVCKEVGSPRIC